MRWLNSSCKIELTVLILIQYIFLYRARKRSFELLALISSPQHIRTKSILQPPPAQNNLHSGRAFLSDVLHFAKIFIILYTIVILI